MTTIETDATIEHRCEALTINEIPPYRCTTTATGGPARQARQARQASWYQPRPIAPRPLVR
jgi:hypothetical protein